MTISAPATASASSRVVLGVSLRHREIARGGSTISRLRRQIASRSGRVAFLGALEARAGGLLAMERRVPPDLTAGLIISGIDAVREVAIGGGLIAIGGGLVAVGADWSRSPLV